MSIDCAVCNAPMVKRFGSYGPFFGCSRWPACKHTLSANQVKHMLANEPPRQLCTVPGFLCAASVALEDFPHITRRDVARVGLVMVSGVERVTPAAVAALAINRPVSVDGGGRAS